MSEQDDRTSELWDASFAEDRVVAPDSSPSVIAVMDEGEMSESLGRFVTAEDAFRVYQSSSQRSLRKTADFLGLPRGTIMSWSSRYSWRARLAETDMEVTEGVAQAVSLSVIQQQMRNIQSLVAIRDSDIASNTDRLNAIKQLAGLYARIEDRAMIGALTGGLDVELEEEQLISMVQSQEGAREILARLRERTGLG